MASRQAATVEADATGSSDPRVAHGAGAVAPALPLWLLHGGLGAVPLLAQAQVHRESRRLAMPLVAHL